MYSTAPPPPTTAEEVGIAMGDGQPTPLVAAVPPVGGVVPAAATCSCYFIRSKRKHGAKEARVDRRLAPEKFNVG